MSEAPSLSSIVVPSSAEDYEASSSLRLENTPEGRAAVREAMTEDEDFALLSDNRKRFPQIFGERSCRWDDWDVWKVRVEPDADLFLLSGSRGTCLELAGNLEKAGAAARFVLESLLPELVKLNEDGSLKPESLEGPALAASKQTLAAGRANQL